MMDLQIKYYKEDIDSELDNKIETFAKDLGYKWYGSGYCFPGKYRELVFDEKKE